MGETGGKTKGNLECWDSSENIELPLTVRSNHTSISDQHFAGNSELNVIVFVHGIWGETVSLLNLM